MTSGGRTHEVLGTHHDKTASPWARSLLYPLLFPLLCSPGAIFLASASGAGLHASNAQAQAPGTRSSQPIMSVDLGPWDNPQTRDALSLRRDRLNFDGASDANWQLRLRALSPDQSRLSARLTRSQERSYIHEFTLDPSRGDLPRQIATSLANWIDGVMANEHAPATRQELARQKARELELVQGTSKGALATQDTRQASTQNTASSQAKTTNRDTARSQSIATAQNSARSQSTATTQDFSRSQATPTSRDIARSQARATSQDTAGTNAAPTTQAESPESARSSRSMAKQQANPAKARRPGTWSFQSPTRWDLHFAMGASTGRLTRPWLAGLVLGQLGASWTPRSRTRLRVGARWQRHRMGSGAVHRARGILGASWMPHRGRLSLPFGVMLDAERWRSTQALVSPTGVTPVLSVGAGLHAGASWNLLQTNSWMLRSGVELQVRYGLELPGWVIPGIRIDSVSPILPLGGPELGLLWTLRYGRQADQ